MKNIDLRLGDCLKELEKIPSNSIDLVVTDPAYESMMRWQGIGTTARMGMGKKGSGSDNLDEKWFEIFPNDDLPDLVQEIHRVLKPERVAYIMCDWETLKLLHTFAIAKGVFAPVGYGGLFEPCKPLILDWGNSDEIWSAFIEYTSKWLMKYASDLQDEGNANWSKTGFVDDAKDLLTYLGGGLDTQSAGVLVWDKMMSGTGYTYRTRHEYILMLWKGKKRKLNNLSVPDVLQFKKPWGNERIFPTQKPIELYELLILQSTRPGETVLDMFLGSGTGALASIKTKRKFIGVEKNLKAFNLAQERVEKYLAEEVDA